MKITMVCWGNICRSPMAERILQQKLSEAGIGADEVSVDSVGISSEELGNPMDPRAVSALESRGYRASGHTARQATKQTVRGADLLIAAEAEHADRLRQLGARDDQIRLMTDFDPDSEAGSPLPDPWFGGSEDFDSTLGVLERGMPVLVDELKR